MPARLVMTQRMRTELAERIEAIRHDEAAVVAIEAERVAQRSTRYDNGAMAPIWATRDTLFALQRWLEKGAP